jgi:hypothetical protein
MYNPENAEWFLRNATGIVNNRKKVNSLAEGCNVIAPPSSYSAEDQYALDFRNANVSKWWLDEVIGQFTDSDVLDGFYWDCPSVTAPFSDNRPDDELAAINAAMSATREVAKGKIAAAGKWSLGMMAPMATPEKCPMACTLSWRPQSQFNCSLYACDRSTKTCEHQMKNNLAHMSEPSVMYVPYVSAESNPNGVSCDSPAAVVDPTEPHPLELSCLPGSGALSIDFASFGTPTVSHSAGGRFVTCAGPGCGGVLNGSTFWEDVDAGKLYPVGVGSDACSECLHRQPRCSLTVLAAAAFNKREIVVDQFSCAVQRRCSAFAADSSCDAGPEVLATLKAACDGKQSCVVNVSDGTLPKPHGCPAHAKLKLAVRAGGCAYGTSVAGFREELAAFLITRGPHTWMGHNWIAGAPPTWYPEWDLDFGEPVGLPLVVGSTFSRTWTKFNVSLDCDHFEAHFHTL